jgi:hypothetical protein
MNNFGLIFDIIKTVKALPLVLNKRNNSASISEIMKILYDVSKEQDVEALWERLQQDKKLRSKLIDKMMKLTIEKEKLVYQDRDSARKRDIKIRRFTGSNFRADIMISMTWCAIIFMVGSLLYFRNSLTGDIVLIFSSIISFLGSILAEAHFFEFGAGRGKRKKK